METIMLLLVFKPNYSTKIFISEKQLLLMFKGNFYGALKFSEWFS